MKKAKSISLAMRMTIATIGYIIFIIGVCLLSLGPFSLMILIPGYIIAAIGCGLITKYMLPDNKSSFAFVLGLVLNILGIVIAYFMKPKKVVVMNNNSSNKYEDLEKLQKLKEQGIITEAEFLAEKEKLLK